MSNQPPIEVPQGAIRFNTDSQRMEFFAQDRWHEFATEESSGLGGSAFRTGGPGFIRVEIQDAEGRPLPNYRLDQSEELIGDQLNRVMTWKGQSNLAELIGKPVRLRIVMKDANLYSIRFQSSIED